MNEAFRCTIAISNAAFDNGSQSQELARILREISELVECGRRSGRAIDINGNDCGGWRVDI
jgi:hypothetical protein